MRQQTHPGSIRPCRPGRGRFTSLTRPSPASTRVVPLCRIDITECVVLSYWSFMTCHLSERTDLWSRPNPKVPLILLSPKRLRSIVAPEKVMIAFPRRGTDNDNDNKVYRFS